jgi:hypothetical protein
VALAIVSLRFASDGWLALVAGVTMAAFFVSIILAAVDRGPRQAFAIGFALTLAGYGLIVLNGATSTANSSTKNHEMDPYSGKLPTTLSLRYIRTAIVRVVYIDNNTREVVPDYDSAQMKAAGLPATAFPREIPARETFMPIGHCWWGLLLAYCSGHFARFVYGRRVQEQAAA